MLWSATQTRVACLCGQRGRCEAVNKVWLCQTQRITRTNLYKYIGKSYDDTLDEEAEEARIAQEAREREDAERAERELSLIHI